MIKKGVIASIMILLTLVLSMMAGCGQESVNTSVSPDPFTASWNLGDEGRGISISGNTAGHEAGEVSEFVVTFDNTRGNDTWSGTWCLVLLDNHGIVMEITREEFTVPAGLAPQITVPVEFDAGLHGPYGLSLTIPNRMQQVTTIWVGTQRQGNAGPWPQIIHCSPEISEEDGRALAEEFVLNSSTWLFDGIEGSLVYVKTEDMVTDSDDGSDKSNQFRGWRFTYRFESSQAGYGDRSGQMLAQVITPHEAVVTVENGKITSAVLDGTWDMIAQRMLEE